MVRSLIHGLWVLLSLQRLCQRASGSSSPSDASWLTASAPNIGTRGQDTRPWPFGNSPRGTLFPRARAVTVPGGCTQQADDLPEGNPMRTEFVAKIQVDGNEILGKAPQLVCSPGACFDETCAGFFTYVESPSGNLVELQASDLAFVGSKSTGPTGTAAPYFEVLLQPPPGEPPYTWVHWTGNDSSTEDFFDVNGLTPCCVPFDDIEEAVTLKQIPLIGPAANGSIMASCDVQAKHATFGWYAAAFTMPLTANVQLLVNAASNATAVSPNPGPALSPLFLKLPTQRTLFPVTENLTPATLNATGSAGGTGWQAASFPGGCSTNVTADTLSSNPYNFPISGATQSSSPGLTPSWYLPSAALNRNSTPGPINDWYPALFDADQVAGRPISSTGAWTWGRAYVANGTWQAVFPQNGREWRASLLAAPGNFSILGGVPDPSGHGYVYDHDNVFQYGDVSWASRNSLDRGSELVMLGNEAPCCLDASVPSQTRSGTTGIGKVLGICNLADSSARITWLGATYPQDINSARLLTVHVYSRPGGSFPIAAVVVPVVVLLLGVAILGYFGYLWRRRLHLQKSHKEPLCSPWNEPLKTRSLWRSLLPGKGFRLARTPHRQAASHGLQLDSSDFHSSSGRSLIHSIPEPKLTQELQLTTGYQINSLIDFESFLAAEAAHARSSGVHSHAHEGDAGERPMPTTQQITRQVKQSLRGAAPDTWEVDLKALQLFKDAHGKPQRLGSGGSGIVYKGLYRGVREVAVKVVSSPDPVLQTRLVLEIAMLREMRDPNIILFMGASVQPGRTLLLMQFMQHGNLWEALRRDNSGTFGWYEIGQRILREIASGMEYLHASGYLHLDLKSPNVLLDEFDRAVVADIGLGKMANADSTVASGRSPMWASPEQRLGQPCSAASDVFSFGVVLWEVCSREPLTDGARSELRSPQDCPEAIVALQNACCCQHAADRPTMKEVCGILASASGSRRMLRSSVSHMQPRMHMPAAPPIPAQKSSASPQLRGSDNILGRPSRRQETSEPIGSDLAGMASDPQFVRSRGEVRFFPVASEASAMLTANQRAPIGGPATRMPLVERASVSSVRVQQGGTSHRLSKHESF